MRHKWIRFRLVNSNRGQRPRSNNSYNTQCVLSRGKRHFLHTRRRRFFSLCYIGDGGGGWASPFAFTTEWERERDNIISTGVGSVPDTKRNPTALLLVSHHSQIRSTLLTVLVKSRAVCIHLDTIRGGIITRSKTRRRQVPSLYFQLRNSQFFF